MEAPISSKLAEETIYLCNFRVSVDGDWLCLRELTDVHFDVAGFLASPGHTEADDYGDEEVDGKPGSDGPFCSVPA